MFLAGLWHILDLSLVSPYIQVLLVFMHSNDANSIFTSDQISR